MPESFENRKEKISAPKKDPKEKSKKLQDVVSDGLKNFTDKVRGGAREFTLALAKQIVEDATKKNKSVIRLSMKGLTPEIVRELAKFNGDLYFEKVGPLNKEMAKELSKHEGDLHLSELWGIKDEETAKELIKHKQGVFLYGPMVLGLEEVGEILSKHNMLFLRMENFTMKLFSVAWSEAILEDIFSEEKLGYRKIQSRRFTVIDKADAKKLVEHYQTQPYELLDLGGVTTIDVETARELAKYNRCLILTGLINIDAEVAKELAKLTSKEDGRLFLDGLTTIDAETARELAKHNHPLSLRGLTDVNMGVAKELVKHGKSGKWLQFNKAIQNKMDKGVLQELDKHGNLRFIEGSVD